MMYKYSKESQTEKTFSLGTPYDINSLSHDININITLCVESLVRFFFFFLYNQQYMKLLLPTYEASLVKKIYIYSTYIKSSDAKASKCHLKFSSKIMIFIKLVSLSPVISLKWQ